MFHKRSWRIIIFAVLLLLAPMPLVFATFPEGFDTYPASSVPTTVGPWNITYGTDSICWASSGVAPLPSALSTPNVFLIDHHAGGSCGTDSMNLELTFTAISFGITWEFNLMLEPGSTIPGGGSTTFHVSIVSGTCTSVSNPTLDIDSTYNTWKSFNFTASAIPGQTCIMRVQVASSDNDMELMLDSTNLLGGVARPLTSHNIQLVDSRSLLPFDIAAYPSSSISINYTSSVTCSAPFVQTSSRVCALSDTPGVSDRLMMPFFSNTLINASLITFHVGTSYYRTLVPLSTNVTIYLDIPNAVGTYSITINDLSGTFGAGSPISIKNGITITSGYFDKAATFTAAVIPGVYQALITQGGHTFQTTLSFGTQPTIAINIAKFSTSNNLGFLGIATYGFTWNCANTGLISTFNDPSNSTIRVAFTIWNETQAGSAKVIDSHIFSPGPFGTIMLNTNGINATLGTYRMNLTATDGLGVHSTGLIYPTGGSSDCPNNFPSILGNIFPQLNFPASVFGLDQFNGLKWNNIFALFLVTLTAGVFGARQNKFGFVVVGFESIFFFFALLLPPIYGGYVFYYSMVAISIIGFLRYKSGPVANFLPALVIFSLILNVSVPFANTLGISGGTMPFDPGLSVDTLLHEGAGCNRLVNGTVTCTTDFGNLGLLGGFAAFGNFIWAILKLLLFVPTVIFLPALYMTSIFYAPVAFAALYNIAFVTIFVFWLADYIANRNKGDVG